MACSAIRQVGATYRGLWTKYRSNIKQRKAKYTRKRFKGLEKPPKFVSPTLTYTYGRDYSFKPGQQVSILTLQGRIRVAYRSYEPHVALIQRGATIGAARLWYDKSRQRYFLLVSLELELDDPIPERQRTVVGVDVGMRYLAATATMTNTSRFYPGQVARAKADHYARLRKRLQCKGTRSATHRLMALSGRERRLKLQANHVIAQSIVAAHHHSLLGLEELSGIRERTRRRKRRRVGKRILPLTPRQRRANRHASQWSFAELHNMIAYQAVLAESLTIKVDADYTSQACPMCGYRDKKNRPQKGLLFICQHKQCPYRLEHGRPYTLHADLGEVCRIAVESRYKPLARASG